MNKFFNKISLDLNPSFEGVSKISECNFDKFELNILRVARLLFESNEDPNALTWKSAFLIAEQNFSSPFGASIAHIISISVDFMSNGRTRNFSYIRENNSSALTLITDEERYFLMTLKSMRNNNISKANSYAVMLCEGPQINKFLLAMEGIAIITGDIEKKAAEFNGAVDGARTLIHLDQLANKLSKDQGRF